jgi:2-polyprenyl-6-methoxyphenol hydroxylase-like FAD-dependent oxidoreductase
MAALEIVDVARSAMEMSQPLYRQVLSVGPDKRLELPKLSGVGPLHVIRRGDLHRILRDAAAAQGVRFEHGKRWSSSASTPRPSPPSSRTAARPEPTC